MDKKSLKELARVVRTNAWYGNSTVSSGKVLNNLAEETNGELLKEVVLFVG